MGPTFTLGAGLIGLAWWLLRRTFKRASKPKLLPLDKPLSIREPDELSVLSYNVLADNIVRATPSYNYAPELFCSWEYRYDKLKEQITTLNADVVCLQEVEIAKWTEWRHFMDDLGYTGVLLTRQRSEKKKGRDRLITNATFYRSRKFRLCWEHHCRRVLGIALNWVSANGQEHKFYVINVHLEANPYRPAERVHQVDTILSAIEREQAGVTEEYDMVFCGDFNSTRWNAPWNYLYRGRLEAGYTEHYYPDIEVVKETKAHPFALNDVYKVADAIPDFTARAPRRRSEADFIFSSRHLRVAAVLRAIDPRVIPNVDRTLLPNRQYPSDHIPIGVVLLQPKSSEPNLRSYHSARSRYSADADPTFCEGTSGSVFSDSVNNVDLRASVETLDGQGGVTLLPAAQSSYFVANTSY